MGPPPARHAGLARTRPPPLQQHVSNVRRGFTPNLVHRPAQRAPAATIQIPSQLTQPRHAQHARLVCTRPRRRQRARHARRVFTPPNQVLRRAQIVRQDMARTRASQSTATTSTNATPARAKTVPRAVSRACHLGAPATIAQCSPVSQVSTVQLIWTATPVLAQSAQWARIAPTTSMSVPVSRA